MNKYNLFNLYKKTPVSYANLTLYQQKWRAKQETRAYHGEHLTESRWKSIFLSSLESVAQLDASLKGSRLSETPLALQTFAVLEKRLETAVFRAMFASSIRQARQFILTGHVAVNGVTMKHPSFPLRPGDVFAVSPEKVLLAMGRPKPSLDKAVKVDSAQISAWNRYVHMAREKPKDAWDLKHAKPKSLDTVSPESNARTKLSVKAYNDQIDRDMIARQKSATRESVLLRVLDLGSSKDAVDASAFAEYGPVNAEKCFQAYTLLANAKHPLVSDSTAKLVSSFVAKKKPEFTNEAEHTLASRVKQLLSEIVKDHVEHIRRSAQQTKLPDNASSVPFSPHWADLMRAHPKLDKEAVAQDELLAKVRLPWQRGLFGRADPSKPYFTPWAPRAFVGCFAILPAHLEIAFDTCHAVYMRDPIARPGNSEVISPFPVDVHERAYMHYG